MIALAAASWHRRVTAWEREERESYELALDRNERILRLAEQNGYPIDLRPDFGGIYGGRRLFFVPHQLVAIAGAHALVVR